MFCRFEGEGGIKKIDPIKLTKIIKEQIGEVKYARILGDGNLLIGCNTKSKWRRLTNVGKIKVLKAVRVGEKRINGCKGVIYGVPIHINIKELVESIKWKMVQ